MAKAANAKLQQPQLNMNADAGYSNGEQFQACEDAGITVSVPLTVRLTIKVEALSFSIVRTSMAIRQWPVLATTAERRQSRNGTGVAGLQSEKSDQGATSTKANGVGEPRFHTACTWLPLFVLDTISYTVSSRCR